MALPTNTTQYGGLKSQADSSIDQVMNGSGGTHQLTPYQSQGLQYDQPLQNLRVTQNQATINPLGTGDIQDRINSLTNSYYSQAQAQQNARNMLTASNFNRGLDILSNIRTDPNTARNIFQGAYNMGLVGPMARDNQDNYHPLGATSQDNPNSLESQYAAINRGVFGAANQANLMYQGINPNAVSQAYQNFLTSNT
jgi:hypothetical protein